MIRHSCKRRDKWFETVNSLGLTYAIDPDGQYWDEGHCYEFSEKQILEIEQTTGELHDMCMAAVEYVIKHDRFSDLHIPFRMIPLIIRSWEREDRPLQGRFDLCFDQEGTLKMLEYNADTPFTLLETSVVQWDWLQHYNSKYSQFNTLHEKLVERWKQVTTVGSTVYVAAGKGHIEDYVNAEYMAEVLIAAGMHPQFIHLSDIGWSQTRGQFEDLDHNKIGLLYKLYPWEMLIEDEFGPHLSGEPLLIVEPAWKVVMSGKGLLPILWELFPGHKNLLPAYFSPEKLGGSFVKKPVWGRDGSNIEIHTSTVTYSSKGNHYSNSPAIYQSFVDIPDFEGKRPILGSWIIGHEPAGMGIREDKSLVTESSNTFVPHFFIPSTVSNNLS